MKHLTVILILLLVYGCGQKNIPQSTQEKNTMEEKSLLILLNDTLFNGEFSDIDMLSLGKIQTLYDSVKIAKYGMVSMDGLIVVHTQKYLDYLDSIENHVDSIKLIFVGDVMGHQSQIKAAFDPTTNQYNYQEVFEKMAPLFHQADITIGNLEVTLAGPPYTGYPEFSSPDDLAVALQKNGVDILMTANNHSCDLGGEGLVRTIKVLDSLKIDHTGTFLDTLDREKRNLLVIDKNNLRIGVLNYTYGTNYLPNPPPTLVNRIDTALIKADLENAKQADLDKLIAFIHWGKEYIHEPTIEQIELTSLLFKNGVDIIIGSHPHVLQKMVWIQPADSTESLAVFSLGNFVSDQRTHPRDGGAIFELSLTKQKGITKIYDAGYYLTWVHKYTSNGKKHYQVLPAATYETNKDSLLSVTSLKKMKLFLDKSRKLLNAENIGINEKIYSVDMPVLDQPKSETEKD